MIKFLRACFLLEEFKNLPNKFNVKNDTSYFQKRLIHNHMFSTHF